MLAELPTPSKAVPNPRLRQRNETISPRLSLFRGLDRSLGMGFSGENLVAGLVAGSAASRGVSENIRHGWYSFPGYRHYHAPAADRLCHRPYWWVAARVINGPLETFPRYHRNARPRIANAAQRVLGPSRAFVVRANRSSDALCRGNGNTLVGRDCDRYRGAACSADLPAGGGVPGGKTVVYFAFKYTRRRIPLFFLVEEGKEGGLSGFASWW